MRSTSFLVAVVAVVALSAVVGGAGCASLGRPPGPAAPPTGSDADIVFQEIASVRRAQGVTPPTWIGKLAPTAQEGAARLAEGGDTRAVADQTAKRAVYQVGRNVEVWYMFTDSLYGMQYQSRMVGGRNLMLAIGVAPMQRGGAGRYAVFMIMPEPGGAVQWQ
jgi:hypothetical protein